MLREYIFESNYEDSTYNSSGSIYIIRGSKQKEELDLLASEPKRQGDYIAYICPYDFEIEGNIYLYNLKNGIKEEVYRWSELKSPKYLQWKDDKTLYVILGETYGTIAIGGNLYSLKIHDRKLTLLKEFPVDIQVTSFNIKDNRVELKGIKYIDNNLNEFQEYNEIIDL